MTKDDGQKNIYAVMLIGFGMLGCMIMGFCLYGATIFNIRYASFQFVAYGVLGPVVFSLFILRKYYTAAVSVILLFVIDILLAGNKYLLTHVLHFAGFVLAMYIFAGYYYDKMKMTILGRPLVLAGIVSLMHLFVRIVLNIVYYSEIGKFYQWKYVPIGFFVGLGLGLGFECAEYLFNIYQKKQS